MFESLYLDCSYCPESLRRVLGRFFPLFFLLVLPTTPFVKVLVGY